MIKGLSIIIAALVFCCLIAAAMTGCTKFNATVPGGMNVSEWGAPLVNRKAGTIITHQWLDEETNTLHETRIQRNVDEDTSGQESVTKYLIDKLDAKNAAGVVTP